jgi:NADPH:quinone reductase-like Zn-dependent oxidoreductase
MKAAIYDKYGPPDVLKIEEVENPVPLDNEVLIRVHASTVTSGDCPRRRGEPFVTRFFFGLTKPKKNLNIPGSEFAGEVISVGKSVQRFKEGTNVFGLTGWNLGANAEYICLPENGMVVTMPTNINYEEAASIPFGGITALYFLNKANIKAEQKVLIYGASGSVGTAAVQLAKRFGAVVTGVCSTANLKMVKSLGAKKVIDYTKDDFTKGGEKYDVIFDTVGKISSSQCKNQLKPTGTYLATVFGVAAILEMIWTSKRRKKVITGVASQKTKNLIFLKELMETGELKAVIDSRFPLKLIGDAHRYVETGRKKGAVIITMEYE